MALDSQFALPTVSGHLLKQEFITRVKGKDEQELKWYNLSLLRCLCFQKKQAEMLLKNGTTMSGVLVSKNELGDYILQRPLVKDVRVP